MREKTKDYNEYLYSKLMDPKFAASYLSACDDDSTELLLVAMRDVAEAHKMSKVALGANLSRESLYRTLSASGHPQHETLKKILRAFGLKFSVTTIEVPPRKVRSSRKTARSLHVSRSTSRTTGRRA